MVLFLWLFKGRLVQSTAPISRSAASWAVTALVFTSVYFLLQPVRMLGTWSAAVDPAIHALVLKSGNATAIFLQLAGIVLMVFGLRVWRQNANPVARAGSLLVLVSFVFVGHTTVQDWRWALASVLLIHLLVVALWFGSLRSLILAADHESIRIFSGVLTDFSSLATRLVPVLFLAGVGLSFAIVKSVDGIYTTYGSLLVLKVAVFSILLLLAALNKWRLAPAVGQGNSRSMKLLRRIIIAEWVLISVVLCLTALMTGMYSPSI